MAKHNRLIIFKSRRPSGVIIIISLRGRRLFNFKALRRVTHRIRTGYTSNSVVFMSRLSIIY